MNGSPATRLGLEDHRTTLLSDAAAPEGVLAVGLRGIAEGLFRHAPPRPFEIEQAIDRIEVALAAGGLRQAAAGMALRDIAARRRETPSHA